MLRNELYGLQLLAIVATPIDSARYVYYMHYACAFCLCVLPPRMLVWIKVVGSMSKLHI